MSSSKEGETESHGVLLSLGKCTLLQKVNIPGRNFGSACSQDLWTRHTKVQNSNDFPRAGQMPKWCN